MTQVERGKKNIRLRTDKILFVQVGEQLGEFGPVCEVQSDKANVEITSPHTGLVKKLYVSVGDMIQVRVHPTKTSDCRARGPEATTRRTLSGGGAFAGH